METAGNSFQGKFVDVSSERTMGLIGSILAFAGIIPYVGGFLSLLSLVLILIALHGIGTKLNDDRPFKYYLKGFIVGLVAVAIGVIVVFGTVTLSGAHTEHSTNQFIFSPGSDVTIVEKDYSGLSSTVLAAVILGVVIIIAGLILVVYFDKKAWESMYELTKVEAFKSTANFLWWGGLTLIIFVGLILLLVAAIYQIIAFANLPQQISRRPTPQSDTPIDEFTW